MHSLPKPMISSFFFLIIEIPKNSNMTCDLWFKKKCTPARTVVTLTTIQANNPSTLNSMLWIIKMNYTIHTKFIIQKKG